MVNNRYSETLADGLSFDLLPVAGGAFWMGTQKNDLNAQNFDPDTLGDEDPVHLVTVKDFLIGQFPVTQDVWTAIMGENPSYFKGARRPVETVSWDDAQLFIANLNEETQHSRPEGYDYRLPTESEWEYAARGGVRSEDHKYAGSDKLKDIGWFNDNSHQESKPVGLKYPNPLGLYDMSGNVWEWCEDDWHKNYMGAPEDGAPWLNNQGGIIRRIKGAVDNLIGQKPSESRGSRRVFRGGGWGGAARRCRTACRYHSARGYRLYNIGFRLALSLPSPLSAFR
jgi:sulfatase modifying factor 1